MTKSLVTGGAGFIGSHIVEALVAQGSTVCVLDNLITGHRENLAAVSSEITFIEGDIRDAATVAQAMEGVDFVYHLAAMVSVPESMQKPIEAEQINTLGTLNLLRAAETVGVKRMVLSSTCAVYGDEPTLPKLEIMAPLPKSPYAISKLSAEGYCRLFTEHFSVETVILRYFNVYGPRQDPSSPYSGVISIFVDRMRQGQVPQVYGDGNQTRDFVFVSDVVQANLRAASTPNIAGNIFNIGTGHQISIKQLYTLLAEIYQLDSPPIYKPTRHGDILHSYANAAQAHELLGWVPKIPFAEGLKRLVASI